MPSYVVTGASRGIGHAFVRILSKDPKNTIFALVRSKATIRDAAELEKPNIHVLEADITNYEALKRAASEASIIIEGKLDVLINNAAYIDHEYRFCGLDELPDEKVLSEVMHKCIDANVLGSIYATNAFLPLLQLGALNKVIFISTLGADLDLVRTHIAAGEALYSISKAALNMAVAKYAAQHRQAGSGLIFLAMSPGIVQTDALKGAGETPTEKEIAYMNEMMRQCLEVNPSFTGPVAPEESVKAMMKVIDKVTVADSGAFLSHKGSKEWL